MRKIIRGHVFIKKFLFTLGLGLFFFGGSQAQVSGTFTINSGAATGGTNFHSFTDAVAFLQSGLSGSVTFNVVAGSGPYNEQVYLGSAIGTTATKTLTFNCNGVTLTYLSTNTNQRAVVKLDNISYVTFNNLTVVPLATADTEYGYGFQLINNSDNNTIQNCKITNNTNVNTPTNNEGIVINGNNQGATDPGNSNCDNNLIQLNTISGGNTGVTIASAPVSGSPVLVTNNKVLNNTITNPYFAGVLVEYTDGTTVDGNDVSGSYFVSVFQVSGVNLQGFNQSAVVTKNKVHSFQVDNSQYSGFLYGIIISCDAVAGKENLIANNLIYNFISNNWQVGIASRDVPASYFNVYHNTISLDDQTDFGVETVGLYLEQVSNVNAMNNIVSVSRQTSDFNYGVFVINTPSALALDRNDYYLPAGPAFEIATGYYAGTDCITLKDWQKASGVDKFSLATNPQFTSLAALNFIPKAQALDNMGTPVGVTIDITGAARSATTPDPGCYEFTSPACTTPITPGNLVVSDTSICSGSPLVWNLDGTNSYGAGQTYTWQYATSPTGTYTNVTGATNLTYPIYQGLPTASGTLYYKVALTCGATTAYTAPVKVSVHTTLAAGTYTINSKQATSGTNFQTFADAVASLQCGISGPVVFNVVPNTGPYNEQVTIPVINTTAVNTVTFKGNGDTLIYATEATAQRAVLQLNGTHYVTFDSLVVVGSGSSFNYGIQLLNDADHNTITRCHIITDKVTTSTGYAALLINGSGTNPMDGGTFGDNCDSNLVANNLIIGGYYGICCFSKSFTAGTSASVGNKFTGNTVQDFTGYGILVSGCGDALVDSNDVSQPTKKTFSGTVTGIYSGPALAGGTGNNYNLIINQNRVHDLIAATKNSTSVQVNGIASENSNAVAATPNIISNNLIYNIYGAGLQYGLYTLTSSYLKFYHNTVSLEDTGAVTGSGILTRGFGYFSAINPTPGAAFENNNIVMRRGGAGTKTCVYLNVNDASQICNYNNYLITAAGGTNYTGNLGGVSGTNYVTLSNWQATGRDANSIALDPLFADPVNGDYTPGYIPFDDKGTPVGVTKDINGLARSATKPDIGAYEFTICYPISSPTLRIDSLGVYSVRFAWTPIQYATGYLVSRDGGISWTKPSSGNLGTTHTITGLKSRDTVSLIVKVLGTRWDCPVYYSNTVKATTITDQIFIPNTFTPNGDGKNDVFKVYSNIIKTMHMSIYNQWGEKIFETSDVNGQWDGTYNGKPSPIGVYVYVITMVLATDDSQQVKKGNFNLIR